MTGKDHIEELLEKHFSDFEPRVPDMPAGKFYHKLYGYNRKKKFFHNFIFSALIFFLVILNLPEYPGFRRYPGKGDIVPEKQLHSGKTVKDPSVVMKNIPGNFNNPSRTTRNSANDPVFPVNRGATDNYFTGVNRLKNPGEEMSPKPGLHVNQAKVSVLDSREDKTGKPPKKNDQSSRVTCHQGTATKNREHAVWLFRITGQVNRGINDYSPAGKFAGMIHEDYSLIRNRSEKDGPGYSIGINLEYWPRQRIGFCSGLFFNEYRTTAKYDFFNNKIPFFNADGYIMGYVTGHDSTGIHRKAVNRYYFVQLPLVAYVRIYSAGRYSLNLKAGADFIYWAYASGTTLQPSELSVKSIESGDYRSLDYGTMAGINLRYRLDNRYSVGVEPEWTKTWGHLFAGNMKTKNNFGSFILNLNLYIRIK